MKRFVLTLAVFVSAVMGFAQEMMPPPEELKKLEVFKGTWKGTLSGEMEGQKLEGTMTMTSSMEGMFIRVSNTMDIMGMKMTEVGYIGWDSDKKKYSVHWFTNFGETPRIEWATLEGNKFVSLGEPWKSAGSPAPIASRSTLSVNGSEMLLTVEFKMEDEWVPALKANLKKS